VSDGGGDDVQRPEAVDLLVEPRLADRRADPGACGEVHDGVDRLLAEEGEDGVAVPDVPLDQAESGVPKMRSDVAPLQSAGS
jgi:hypothetical protein